MGCRVEVGDSEAGQNEKTVVIYNDPYTHGLDSHRKRTPPILRDDRLYSREPVSTIMLKEKYVDHNIQPGLGFLLKTSFCLAFIFD